MLGNARADRIVERKDLNLAAERLQIYRESATGTSAENGHEYPKTQRAANCCGPSF